jgi:hypothetical protein
LLSTKATSPTRSGSSIDQQMTTDRTPGSVGPDASFQDDVVVSVAEKSADMEDQGTPTSAHVAGQDALGDKPDRGAGYDERMWRTRTCGAHSHRAMLSIFAALAMLVRHGTNRDAKASRCQRLLALT